MAATGVIEPSDSPWAAPAFLVKNNDNSWRFCMDYRCLNAVTKKDSYPLPHINNALDYISGSKCDLRSFLGLASYHRRYVRNFATIARPLHLLTDHGQPYVWDDPCAQAFNTL
ncbi:hypothetical protein AAFF_G00128790 [Aldrovandia affinis]|uniref:Uncharacterized protein n=1 Tax=Aldrovandia affinis TaxID=143900 RepID=A0AAD7WXG7_9TELE|nr:hypothetical protein AAFF_G00128790 [Aldrovandia affinis]